MVSRSDPLPLIRIVDDHHEQIPNSHRANLQVEASALGRCSRRR